jgi:hypothetical protein
LQGVVAVEVPQETETLQVAVERVDTELRQALLEAVLLPRAY